MTWVDARGARQLTFGFSVTVRGTDRDKIARDRMVKPVPVPLKRQSNQCRVIHWITAGPNAGPRLPDG